MMYIKTIKRVLYNIIHPIIGEVWQLHRVTNEHSVQERMRPYEITPQRLESLIIEYKNKGYDFISIAEVALRMSSKKVFLSGKTYGKGFISITLDDGYADNFEVAYPIFKKYNIPFCIYLCEEMVRGELQEDGVERYRFLSDEQLYILKNEPLCTLGGHTTNHVHLAQLNKEHQQEEIVHCKQWIESIISSAMLDFAYPYGSYNADTISILQEYGIKRAVAAWGGQVMRNTYDQLLTIPRLLVTENEKK